MSDINENYIAKPGLDEKMTLHRKHDFTVFAHLYVSFTNKVILKNCVFNLLANVGCRLLW